MHNYGVVHINFSRRSQVLVTGEKWVESNVVQYLNAFGTGHNVTHNLDKKGQHLPNLLGV